MWEQILPGLRIKTFMTALLGVGVSPRDDRNQSGHLSEAGERKPDQGR